MSNSYVSYVSFPEDIHHVPALWMSIFAHHSSPQCAELSFRLRWSNRWFRWVFFWGTGQCAKINTSVWWWLEHDFSWLFYFPIQLGMSSSQLTNSYFFRGFQTTNQTWLYDVLTQTTPYLKALAHLYVFFEFFNPCSVYTYLIPAFEWLSHFWVA